jgi:hypothetical protein
MGHCTAGVFLIEVLELDAASAGSETPTRGLAVRTPELSNLLNVSHFWHTPLVLIGD